MLVQMLRVMCTPSFPFLVQILYRRLSQHLAVTLAMAAASRMFFLSDLHSNKFHDNLNMWWIPLVSSFECSKAYPVSNCVDAQIDKAYNLKPYSNMALELHESRSHPEVC